jgi:hypothetical protein
MRAAIPCVI